MSDEISSGTRASGTDAQPAAAKSATLKGTRLGNAFSTLFKGGRREKSSARVDAIRRDVTAGSRSGDLVPRSKKPLALGQRVTGAGKKVASGKDRDRGSLESIQKKRDELVDALSGLIADSLNSPNRVSVLADLEILRAGGSLDGLLGEESVQDYGASRFVFQAGSLLTKLDKLNGSKETGENELLAGMTLSRTALADEAGGEIADVTRLYDVLCTACDNVEEAQKGLMGKTRGGGDYVARANEGKKVLQELQARRNAASALLQTLLPPVPPPSKPVLPSKPPVPRKPVAGQQNRVPTLDRPKPQTAQSKEDRLKSLLNPPQLGDDEV